MTTVMWYAEIGAGYLAVSFVVAVIIGRCLRGNSVDYPLIDAHVSPLQAEMAAFEPDDCVKVDTRARIRPVNFANLRRKQARAAQHPIEDSAAVAVRSIEKV